MSHVTTGKTCITSLEDARAAAEELGGTLVAGQESYTWYGRYLNDWDSERAAVRHGRVRAEDLGKCEHVIRMPGHRQGSYEIGLVRRPDGKGWDTVYDAFGGEIEKAYGRSLSKLKTEIGLRALRRTCRGRRITITRLEDGKVRARVQ